MLALAGPFENLAKALKGEKVEQGNPSEVLCPDGHGVMYQVQPEDRIYVRSANVEKIVDLEQGERKAIKEESRLFKFNETDDRVYACLAWDMTKCACVDVRDYNYRNAKDEAKGILWEKYSNELLEHMRSEQGEDKA